MQYILALTTALAALAAAMPHPRNHLRLHHARDVSLESSVAGQSISTRDLPVDHINGICGGTSPYGCQSGYCCSQWGFCGNDADYCGVGCQFGACLATGGAAVTTSAPVQTSVIGPASPVVPVSSSTVDDSSTSVPNKAGGGGGPGSGAPTWPATSWSAPSQPTTFASSIWSAPSQPTTTSAAATSSTPAASPSATSAPASSGSGWTFPINSWAAQLTGWTAGGPAWSSGGNGGSGLGDKYVYYSGDGTTSTGWPSQDQWFGSFEAMWEANTAIMACQSDWHGATNNSPEETADLKAAILSVAAATGVDSRFILAIVMQESKGCVRVITTSNSVDNPGLMQDYNFAASCNTNVQDAKGNIVVKGQAQTPCPSSEIGNMIYQGTVGGAPDAQDNAHTHGLIDALNTAAKVDVSRFYRAAKLYNSGLYSLDKISELSVSADATKCYASDVANRLTGWVHAAHGCSTP